MMDPAFARNSVLSEQLRGLVETGGSAAARLPAADVEFEVFTAPGASRDPNAEVDVVITTNEINGKHGTGPLVKRILRGRSNVFSIRSKNDWGDHDFGSWSVCIPQRGRPRPECFRRVLAAIGNRRVGQALCVPFLNDELLTAIAVKEAYGARLCAYLMDDQNVAVPGIPDPLMREFLQKCSLRLATHPELRAAYEHKYGLRFYLLPAVVPDALVPAEPLPPSAARAAARRGALIGSFWDQVWFDKTCDALEACDGTVDWYGNTQSPWLKFPQRDLERAGIRPLGLLPEPELARRLRDYLYVLVPVSAFDKNERNTGVARLSLPGRILFALATAQIPVLILGSEQTCGARFVQHFGVGEVAPYSGKAVRQAIARISEPARQDEMRRNAAAIGPRFSDRGVVRWLADSIERGHPADNRFEEIFSRYDTGPVPEDAGSRPAARRPG